VVVSDSAASAVTIESESPTELAVCKLPCCSSLDKPHQPSDKKNLSSRLANCKHNFMPH